MPASKETNKAQHKGRLKAVMHDIDAIHRAIEVCGGKRSQLAKQLGVSWQQVELWVKGRSIVTGERAVMIEVITKGEVKREEVRPDLYEPIKNYDEMESRQ